MNDLYHSDNTYNIQIYYHYYIKDISYHNTLFSFMTSFKHKWREICLLSLFSILFVYLFLKHTRVIEGNEPSKDKDKNKDKDKAQDKDNYEQMEKQFKEERKSIRLDTAKNYFPCLDEEDIPKEVCEINRIIGIIRYLNADIVFTYKKLKLEVTAEKKKKPQDITTNMMRNYIVNKMKDNNSRSETLTSFLKLINERLDKKIGLITYYKDNKHIFDNTDSIPITKDSIYQNIKFTKFPNLFIDIQKIMIRSKMEKNKIQLKKVDTKITKKEMDMEIEELDELLQKRQISDNKISVLAFDNEYDKVTSFSGNEDIITNKSIVDTYSEITPEEIEKNKKILSSQQKGIFRL